MSLKEPSYEKSAHTKALDLAVLRELSDNRVPTLLFPDPPGADQAVRRLVLGQSPIQACDVPDAAWPTDNPWGIPLLNKHLEADFVDLPVLGWGSVSRVSRMPGTWHFYTDDYRFTALWKDPTPVVNSGCVNVVEPNFSVFDQMPRAVAVYRIYQKRWLARYWQAFGIRVLVDMNVSERHAEMNLLGVPRGWRAYATRGYRERLWYIELQHQMAVERACTEDILFMVYGGGRDVEELCGQEGWIWVPEKMDVAKGKRESYAAA